MLAETAERPSPRKDWLFELKLDGYRLLAARGEGEPLLLTRNGNDYTAALSRDRARGRGRCRSTRWSSTARWSCSTTRAPELSAAPEARPAAAGRSTSGTPRSSRRPPSTPSTCSASRTSTCGRCRSPSARRSLRRVLPPVGPLRYLDHVEEEGEALYQETERLGLEGIVGEEGRLALQGGPLTGTGSRSASRQTGDFVVVGFTAPKGSRGGFGALQLADYVDGELVYAGRAGTGFSDKQLGER